MIFKKLILENIRSYENLEIEFPKGSVLLSGDIGSGKTSVLLGLQFALFGLQPGQKGASILRNGKEHARVVLEMEVENSTVILERSLKKSSSGSISQEESTVTIDGKLEDLSTSEMKNKVLNLLNYPKEFVKKSNLLYKFTVYTPQEEMKEIIQERPEIRLDTLRHIFGIDRYKRIKENVQIFVQRLKDEIKLKEVLINELNLLKEKFNEKTENKIKTAREIVNADIELRRILEEKSAIEARIDSVQKVIDERNSIQNELEKSVVALCGKKDFEERVRKEISLMQKQISEKIDFSEDKLKSIKEILEKHRLNLEDLNSKFLAINSRISVLNSKKDHLISLKNNVSSLENCPTCFQQVSSEHKEKMGKRTQFEIEDFNRELEQKMLDRIQIEKDLVRERELIRGYENDLSSMERDKIRFEHQKNFETKIKSDVFVLDRARNEILELNQKISELKEKNLNFEKADGEFKKSKSELDEISRKLRLREISLAEKNKELEITKKSLDELSVEIEGKEKIREQVNRLRALQDWLQDKFLSMIFITEKNVMTKLRSDFSDLFGKWFSMLVPEGLSVSLDGDFTPLIMNQDYEIDYDFLSGGERTAIALSYRLALNQVLNSLLSKIKTKDILILDEPTEGFSAEQLDKMRDLFEQLRFEQMILVSHEQKIEGFVDNVIRIRKEGTSLVEK